jgi:hypothetical protein
VHKVEEVLVGIVLEGRVFYWDGQLQELAAVGGVDG